MKKFYQRYKHAVPMLVFGLIYVIWFSVLESHVVNQYTVIHMKIDDLIPFCEWFIIPYFLWFAYIAVTLVYFFMTDKKDYVRFCIFLAVGMTLFLVVSTVFPNGQNLRPETFPRDNLLTRLVGWLYKTDSSTNILPSIHVYNSIGTHIAIAKSARLKDKKLIHMGSFLLSLSIILATVFLKQHSMVDVIAAVIMVIVVYAFVYVVDYNSQEEKAYRRKRKTES